MSLNSAQEWERWIYGFTVLFGGFEGGGCFSPASCGSDSNNILEIRRGVGMSFKWHVLWTRNSTDTKLSGAIVKYIEMPWRSDGCERIFVSTSEVFLAWYRLTGRGAVIPSKLEMQGAQWTLYVFAVIGGASPYIPLCPSLSPVCYLLALTFNLYDVFWFAEG